MVARDRQRLLGAKGERRVEDTAQPIKQRIVGAIAQCIASRVRLDDKVEADHATDGSEQLWRRMLDLVALKPPDTRAGDSHSLCDCLLAQTRPDTGGADVLDQPAQCRTLDGCQTTLAPWAMTSVRPSICSSSAGP